MLRESQDISHLVNVNFNRPFTMLPNVAEEDDQIAFESSPTVQPSNL